MSSYFVNLGRRGPACASHVARVGRGHQGPPRRRRGSMKRRSGGHHSDRITVLVVDEIEVLRANGHLEGVVDAGGATGSTTLVVTPRLLSELVSVI
jgi:hypothetical protein